MRKTPAPRRRAKLYPFGGRSCHPLLFGGRHFCGIHGGGVCGHGYLQIRYISSAATELCGGGAPLFYVLMFKMGYSGDLGVMMIYY